RGGGAVGWVLLLGRPARVGRARGGQRRQRFRLGRGRRRRGRRRHAVLQVGRRARGGGILRLLLALAIDAREDRVALQRAQVRAVGELADLDAPGGPPAPAD